MNKDAGHHMIERIEKASHRWNRVVMVMTSIFILSTMLLVAADVSGRYFFNKPIAGAVEVEQIILAYTAFLCLAYGLIKGTHVRVSLLFGRFPERVKLAAEILAGAAGIALFTVLLWGGIKLFWDSWTIRELMTSVVKLPYWFPKLALPIGAALIVLQFIIHILHQLGILFSKRGEG